MLTKKYFTALQKTEILPDNPVSETRNHTLGRLYNLCSEKGPDQIAQQHSLSPQLFFT